MKKLKNIKSCVIQFCFKHIHRLISFFFIVSIFLVYKCSKDCVFYHLSLAFISSSIFYILVNYVSDQYRRDFFKKRLKISYKKMKKNILTETLLKGFCHEKEIEELLNHEKFRKTFDNGKTGWDILSDAADNAIKDDTDVKKILNEFEIFCRELDEVMFLYPPKNNDRYNAFKDIQSIILSIFSIKNLNSEKKLCNDKADSFYNAVYCLFGGKQFNTKWVTLHDNDFIQDYIDTL